MVSQNRDLPEILHPFIEALFYNNKKKLMAVISTIFQETS